MSRASRAVLTVLLAGADVSEVDLRRWRWIENPSRRDHRSPPEHDATPGARRRVCTRIAAGSSAKTLSRECRRRRRAADKNRSSTMPPRLPHRQQFRRALTSGVHGSGGHEDRRLRELAPDARTRSILTNQRRAGECAPRYRYRPLHPSRPADSARRRLSVRRRLAEPAEHTHRRSRSARTESSHVARTAGRAAAVACGESLATAR
jgi:hypothetical protein